MPGHVLGIDIGTGGTRALIIRADGRIVASATEEHEPFASPKIGWAEQHPEDWWLAAGIAVRKALTQSGLAAEDIACVGFSGQMHGAVMLDGQGEVGRPALIWCDVRTAPPAEGTRCVGFSAQMHGAVMLDGQGEVVRPALIWCAVRTEPQCEELNEK